MDPTIPELSHFHGFIDEDDDSEDFCTDEDGFIASVLAGKRNLSPTVPRFNENTSRTDDVHDTEQNTTNTNIFQTEDEHKKDESTYCGLPFDNTTSMMLQIAYLHDLQDIPVSFRCGQTIHITPADVYRCPCFHAAFPKSVTTFEREKQHSYEPHEWHDHDQCIWCRHSPKADKRLQNMLSGEETIFATAPEAFTTLGIADDGLTVRKARMFNSKESEHPIPTHELMRRMFNNEPLEQKPIPRMKSGFKVNFKLPHIPIHQAHVRVYDTPCNKRCRSPIKRSALLRHHSKENVLAMYGNKFVDKRQVSNVIPDKLIEPINSLLHIAKLALFALFLFILLLISRLFLDLVQQSGGTRIRVKTEI